jgi:hypothetical protein
MPVPFALTIRALCIASPLEAMAMGPPVDVIESFRALV